MYSTRSEFSLPSLVGVRDIVIVLQLVSAMCVCVYGGGGNVGGIYSPTAEHIQTVLTMRCILVI